MNIYKIKKFMNEFNLDYYEMKITKCPNYKIPVSSKYHKKTDLFKAYFNKEDCDKCKYNRKCIKQNFNTDYYEVTIKGSYIYTLKEERKIYTKEEIERLIYMQIMMEIGSIENATKYKGIKYEQGELSYDGEYLDVDGRWYCHGYGKNYYDGKNIEYEGYFKYGHPHGQGKYYYRNGALKWEGVFEAIPGIYIYKHRKKAIKTTEGYADARGRIKYGKAYRDNGSLEYEGEFNLGIPHGQGKLYDENGVVVFSGKFIDGKPVEDN